MKKKQIKFIAITGCIALFFIGISVGMFYKDYSTGRETKINEKVSNLVGNLYLLCGDLELNQTAYCLRDFISRSFDYYPVEESKTMSRSFLEIYEKGGDCLDYSILYSRLIDNFAYYDSEIVVDLKDEHAYVKIYESWGEGDYCILDLIENPECFIREKELSSSVQGNLVFSGSSKLRIASEVRK